MAFLCTRRRRRRLLRRHADVVCGFRFKVSLFRPFARLQRPTLPACLPAWELEPQPPVPAPTRGNLASHIERRALQIAHTYTF